MKPWFIGACLALIVGGCAAGEQPGARRANATQAYRGWYMEHAGQGTLQGCGQSRPWRVAEAADLPARARRFQLHTDTPVYVRVTGSVREETITIATVEQFGSPTPVRDCAMTGVVLPDG
jgi:hypothetical protein